MELYFIKNIVDPENINPVKNMDLMALKNYYYELKQAVSFCEKV